MKPTKSGETDFKDSLREFRIRMLPMYSRETLERAARRISTLKRRGMDPFNVSETWVFEYCAQELEYSKKKKSLRIEMEDLGRWLKFTGQDVNLPKFSKEAEQDPWYPSEQQYREILKDLPAKKEFSIKLAQSVKGQTIIFSDSLDIGREISRRLEVPFVDGKSKNRLATIAKNRISVVSRVGDEGIDTTDLQNVIEVSFLYGSRRQELQRFGRLLHSRYKGHYTIVMTKDEYTNYKKRLLSLYEKGFEVDVREVRS